MDTHEMISENNRPGISAAPLDDTGLAEAALLDVCILLTGTTSVLTTARRIHDFRGRRLGPFIGVDCGLPDRVIERRVFDVLRNDDPEGGEPRRTLPMGATILLEEVWKLSPEQQARLLDALDDPARNRGPRRLRARVIASSSIPLLDRVLDGTFNDRLFYRLNAVHLVLPEDEGVP
jgi:DNA-binding NtrC family response regulator